MAGVELPGCRLFFEQTGRFPRVSMLKQRDIITQQTQRHALFCTLCMSHDQTCCLIIDSGSTNNLVAADMVDRLGLKRLKHPNPYTISWLQEGHQFIVDQQCDVEFTINQYYKDQIICDIVSMDACDILLGRPWQYDRDVIHLGKTNCYTVYKDGINHTLVPITHEDHTLVPITHEDEETSQADKEAEDKAQVEGTAEEAEIPEEIVPITHEDEETSQATKEASSQLRKRNREVEESVVKPAEAAPAEEKAGGRG